MEMAILPTLTSMPMVCPLVIELIVETTVDDGEPADDEVEKAATPSRRVCRLSVLGRHR
jgi:hypothetical protein